MRSTILILTAWICTGVHAQTDGRTYQPGQPDATRAVVAHPDSVRPGTVTVHESGRIAGLMADYATHERTLKGFRVQIFIGDRASAENTRRSFLLKHPDTPAYLSYLAPNFRVRIGDLRDRVSAERMREELKVEFPGSYVVPDDIELPKLTGP